MFRRLLIANRAEIAMRVARTARVMGIRCIGVFSSADRNALHRRSMDESVEIGGPLPAESYLKVEAILRAARQTGAEAIHPGYGFLAENPDFARRCEEESIVLVGPSANAMALSGDKIAARTAMRRAGIPVTSGVDRVVATPEEAKGEASELGYPVLFKATAGGGGIGMSRVDRPRDLADAFASARAAAQANFGSPDLFLEKFVRRARHVEIQVLIGSRGQGIGFVERECSVQRRHQKLVEETPSPAVSSALRRKLVEAAVRGMQAIGYRNAGTVEFLLHDGRFTFNEVNARLQVEHPITELVTGIDLVRQQLVIAASGESELSQSEVKTRGHAIECRVNAEDPIRDFRPSPGRIVAYREPSGPGVRVDSGVDAGSDVPPYYDPLLAKIATHARSRPLSIRRMQAAVEDFDLRGIHTSLPFHRTLLRHPSFRRGELWTTMVADLRIVDRIRSRGRWEETVAAIAATLAVRGRAAMGPAVPLVLSSPSRWSLEGRRERLGGGGRAVPARRRW